MGKKGRKRSRSPSSGKSRLQKAIAKATLTYKTPALNSRTIEAKFPKAVGDTIKEVKENVNIWDEGDSKAQLVAFVKNIMVKGKMYDMFTPDNAMTLAQIVARALQYNSDAYDRWADIVDARSSWTQTTKANQEKEFRNMLVKLTSKIIGKNAWDKQVEAWNEGLM